MTGDRGPADDERALRALVLAYAHHADRRQPELLAELFEPDATLRMVWRSGEVPPAESRGRGQIASAVGRLRQMVATFHLVGNHSIELAGDTASGEVYCEAHHLGSDGVDYVMFIRYLDRYRHHSGAWRFAERETVVEWTETRAPASPP
jgi:SnoaL-like domain